MSYRVEISDRADRDIREIYEYIAFHCLDSVNAKRQLERIRRAFSTLEKFPERCHLCGREPWKSYGLRMLLVDNFYVVYYPDKESETVNVLRVFHASRDEVAELSCIKQL